MPNGSALAPDLSKFARQVEANLEFYSLFALEWTVQVDLFGTRLRAVFERSVDDPWTLGPEKQVRIPLVPVNAAAQSLHESPDALARLDLCYGVKSSMLHVFTSQAEDWREYVVEDVEVSR